ncbi:MAG: helix-turn-helix transcriptional regulator [Candidatus Lokiarchaeota archaeon]|nr:helix-turn-helix transcriptional regulator [Candidatus Lokiarchaeota archaeon]
MKEIGLDDIGEYIKALHCGIRWEIIDFLNAGPKSSDEIFQYLKDFREKVHSNTANCKGNCQKDFKKDIKKQNIYYHLRELEKVGIIVLDEYKPSERAPEKVWKLNYDKLIINFKS